MSKTLDPVNISLEPITPSPSVADVLREYHALDLPAASEAMQPLDAEALEVLGEVSSLLEHAIEANQAATWWQAQHEKAVAPAGQARDTTKHCAK